LKACFGRPSFFVVASLQNRLGSMAVFNQYSALLQQGTARLQAVPLLIAKRCQLSK
jgi:hypothetical protein